MVAGDVDYAVVGTLMTKMAAAPRELFGLDDVVVDVGDGDVNDAVNAVSDE